MPTIDCALQPAADETESRETFKVFALLFGSFILYGIRSKLGRIKKRILHSKN